MEDRATRHNGFAAEPSNKYAETIKFQLEHADLVLHESYRPSVLFISKDATPPKVFTAQEVGAMLRELASKEQEVRHWLTEGRMRVVSIGEIAELATKHGITL